MKYRHLLPLLLVCGFAQASTGLTAQEQELIAQMRAQYAQSGLAPMSIEQEVQALQQYRQQLSKAMSSVMALRQSVSALADSARLQPRAAAQAASTLQAQPVALTAPTTPALAMPALVSAKQLQPLVTKHKAAAAFTQFEPSPGGFKANGTAMVDVEGAVTDYGADTATGDVVYVVKINQTQSLIKYRNINSAQPPVTFAAIQHDGNMQLFQTYDGQRSTGDRVVPTSRGVMIVRAGSLVTYLLGSTLQATAIPDGFSLAELQQGDVSGTGFVLIERSDAATPQAAGLVETFKEAKSLLSSIIKENAYDYALYNPVSGQIIPLNLSKRGKLSTRLSNCERQNDFVNVCKDSNRIESLWDSDGDKNLHHYFWSVYWFNTVHGPVAVAAENTSRELTAYKLDTAQRVVIAQRKLGALLHSASINANGSVSLDFNLAFKRHYLDDIATVFEPGFEPVK